MTTGLAALDGNFGVEAVATGGNATAGNTGAITTNGTFGYGVYAVTSGNGTATATSSGGITTNGPYSTGIGAHIDNLDSTMHGTAIATLEAGGTITTNGSPYGIGVFADVFGYGDAVATNYGTASTQGQFATGVAARVLYGAGDATAVNQGTISTTGIAADGMSAAVSQGAVGNATAINTGAITVTGLQSSGIRGTTGAGSVLIENTGAVASSGVDGNGILVSSVGGGYVVNVNAGSVTGGSGSGAGIRVNDGTAVNVQTGTINIASGSTVTAASGTAIWEGNGQTVITSSGTIAGNVLTNDGDDQLILESSSVTSGQVQMGNGSDLATVRGNANIAGVTLLDGGDDVYTTDGFVDTLTFDGGTRSMDGSTLVNWETIALNSGTSLALQGTDLLVGGGVDVSGNQLGLIVQSGATLSFGQSAFTITGDLSNAGLIRLDNGTVGDILTVAVDPNGPAGASGNYIGNGGTINLDTYLGTDGSASDILHVIGDTAGTSSIFVTNVGGPGAATLSDGILLVDVDGASNGTFTLSNPAGQVIAGAYGYGLWQNGLAGQDGNWYLRSIYIDPGTPIDPTDPNLPPLYQPGVPVYEAYPQVLLGLNGLPTLQQRVGNRYWNEPAPAPAESVFCKDAAKDFKCTVTDEQADYYAGAGGRAVIEGNAIWTRIEAAHGHFEPDTSTSRTDYDSDQWRLQAGVDGQLYENKAGDKLIGGITMHYGEASADVKSVFGNGSIDAKGYGLGLTATWYQQNGFYVDAQAQATWYDSDLNSNLLGGLADGNDGFGYALSLEGGKRIQLKENWTLTPQAQLVYSAVDFDSFTGPNGERVSLSDGDSLNGRLGLSLDHEQSWQDKEGKTRRTHLYGISNLYYEFLDGSSVDVSGTKLVHEPEKLWGSVGLGGSYNWHDDKYSLYGEVSAKTSLTSFADSYSLNGTAGFRLRF
ncbi:autotransporter outer membrane beta-barrel domain-containing protein [Mesorhizobium sp. M1406]|uniref:autotransporter family protein n=1 Tax=Mesorhizobium sp. M1406 TaxID=2957099 RepID=UPI00333C37D6